MEDDAFDNNSSERKRLVREIERTERELKKTRERLERLDRMPLIRELGDGAMIRFRKSFNSALRDYDYVGIRANGQWYLTGRRSSREMSTDRLIEFLSEGVSVVYQCVTDRRLT